VNLIQSFTRWCQDRCLNRGPDKIIRKTDGSVYLERWHVIPRNRFFNIYLHHFRASDDDRALHDHPWLFNASIIVYGAYYEVTPKRMFWRQEGDWKFRWGRSAHRVQLLKEWDPFIRGKFFENPCTTIFITGPVVRQWGFYCPGRWVHWKDFTHFDGQTSTISKGCD